MLKKKNNNILENSFFWEISFCQQAHELVHQYVSFIGVLTQTVDTPTHNSREIWWGVWNRQRETFFSLVLKVYLFLIALTLKAKIGFHFWYVKTNIFFPVHLCRKLPFSVALLGSRIHFGRKSCHDNYIAAAHCVPQGWFYSAWLMASGNRPQVCWGAGL